VSVPRRTRPTPRGRLPRPALRPPTSPRWTLAASWTLAALLLVACGGGASEDPRPPGVGAAFFSAQSVGIEEVTVAVPLGPGTTGEGRCDEAAELPGGRTVLALRWTSDGELLRRVNLTLDAAGEPDSYSDLRGGMTNIGTTGTDVPGTTITLTFPTRVAIVRNQGAGQRSGFRVPFDDALHAGALDRPADRVAEVRERCGG